MILLTAKEVLKYAKGPKSAMDISLLHWWQNKTATMSELSAWWEGASPIFEDLCGLCIFYEHSVTGLCKKCPLAINYCCIHTESLYKTAAYAWDHHLEFDWPKAAKRMFNVLIEVSSYESEEEWLAQLPKVYKKYL